MTYLRFVCAFPIDGMRARAGFLTAAYMLRDDPQLDAHTLDHLNGLIAWFREELPVPDNFTSSRSKGAGQGLTRGLSWFTPAAEGEIAMAMEVKALLDEHGYPVTILRTRKPGRIIYEDAAQIVAEPYADTPV